MKIDILNKIYDRAPFLAFDILQKIGVENVGNCQFVSKQWNTIFERLPYKFKTKARKKLKSRERIEEYFSKMWIFGNDERLLYIT
jgi:hypothetical protein